jgi:hypothetical protein
VFRAARADSRRPNSGSKHGQRNKDERVGFMRKNASRKSRTYSGSRLQYMLACSSSFETGTVLRSTYYCVIKLCSARELLVACCKACNFVRSAGDGNAELLVACCKACNFVGSAGDGNARVRTTGTGTAPNRISPQRAPASVSYRRAR